jgi:hypothetical protein
VIGKAFGRLGIAGAALSALGFSRPLVVNSRGLKGRRAGAVYGEARVWPSACAAAAWRPRSASNKTSMRSRLPAASGFSYQPCARRTPKATVSAADLGGYEASHEHADPLGSQER